ncbi:type IV-A pilus assembly ATPase PilB [Deferrisoma camini]|uniref:type IV-A pilus assembly ATPase PilB n=1 Tax=Deferrisoma camini TaxID=1035120 RepID=UPI00046CA2AA|nr:type IV-A pilus assembly ATPase PilB [Deferrisoma camini]
MSKRLGELLIRENILTPADLERAKEDQRRNGGRLGEALVRLGLVDEQDLVRTLSKQYGVPTVDLANFEIDPEVTKLVPEDLVQKYRIIPINRVGSTLIVAVDDPSNMFALDDVKFLTGYNVEMVLAAPSAIKEAIDRYYDSSATLLDVMGNFDLDELELVQDEEDVDVADLERAVEDAPVVKLVNLILSDAIKKGASDIHIEPYEKSFRVRYRIDGVLYEQMRPPMKLKNAITSRVKIMANLDIAERRLPQDGRIKLKISKNKDMDFRVSVLPTLFGEKIVMRLLDKSNLQLDMTKLGFEEAALKDFQEAIHKPYGMVLVTGPTGSGKTTTLYSALSELNTPETNISTAEDPVEFNLPGINQVQIHEEIGLNFAAALRSFLRQDPDIIMVGEIRDFETAEIAIKAALTGHMVLSTLHTNDAPSTVNRLLNMGVEPFLVASATNLIVAQRLARRICPNCKEAVEVPAQALLDIGVPSDRIGTFTCYRGTGCANCADTGFKGRVALYEVLVITDEIKELILNGASALELKHEAMRQGMKTLRMSGITKLMEGMTTLEEVVRVTVKD